MLGLLNIPTRGWGERPLVGDVFFFFQAEDGIRDADVTGVQTCALPISGDVSASVTTPTPKPLLEETDTSPAAAPVTISIEDVLDELQAGKLTRDEAAARIQIGRASCRERV